MIRCGKLCRHCRGRSCRDESTEEQPIELECPECDGEGCEHCDDGWFRLVGCPSAYVSELGRPLKLVDLFEKGIPPVAGGALDQTAWFLNFHRRCNQEESRIQAES